MRRFELHRDEDPTGISGTGLVAEGVIFHNGYVTLCWRTRYWSMVTYPDITSVEQIHGHHGQTRIVYVDAPEEQDTNGT